MTFSALLVLLILFVAFVLFVSGWIEPDITAVLVLVTLVLTGLLSPAEAFTGFSSFAVVTIAGLMVIGAGLKRTGVVKWVARRLENVIHRRYNRLLLLNTGIPGILSGFVNIVAAAAFFVPVILRLCKQMEVPQSRILLPMACTALIGANLTLIGASHNLVVDSLLADATGSGFGFFEFTAVGAVLLAAALAYIFLLGQRLLPGEERAPPPLQVPPAPDLVQTYRLDDRLFEVWVGEEGDDGEMRMSQLNLADYGVVLIAIVRESEQLVVPRGDVMLLQGDMLLFQGREEVVQRFAQDHAALTFAGVPKSQQKYPLSTGELAEAVVPPRSPAIGRPVRDLGLEESFDMKAIAYYRDGQPHRTGIQNILLQEGDSLLIWGPREKMREFDPERELLIYFKPGEPEVSTRQKRMAPVAALILPAVIVPAALGLMPIAATAVAGAVAMVLIGILPPGEIYKSVDGRTLVLIGGMYPLGVALNDSGAADAVGESLIAVLGGYGPLPVLAGVTVLSMILTQPIHNAAVAIIMTPIAINAANLIDADPRGFCVAVVVGCSAAFLMPYGHPAPYLVQEPGGYRSSDYLRFGLALNVIALAVVLALVPFLWPF